MQKINIYFQKNLNVWAVYGFIGGRKYQALEVCGHPEWVIRGRILYEVQKVYGHPRGDRGHIRVS